VRSATPYGETVYWIGPAGAANDASEGTDFDAITQGFVSVTPLRLDLTQHAQLGQMTEWIRPLCE
jgi:5'-nucleotidase